MFAKLIDMQLVKKYPTFCGIQWFITTFTTLPVYVILSQLSPVHSPTVSLRSIIIFWHLSLCLIGSPFLKVFKVKVASYITHVIIREEYKLQSFFVGRNSNISGWKTKFHTLIEQVRLLYILIMT